MGWKDLPYWVKGGIILASLNMIYSLANMVAINLLNIPLHLLSFNKLLTNISFFPSFEIFRVRVIYPFVIYLGNQTALYRFLLINTIFWLIVGFLFGWIYGKIRKRKEQSN